MKPLATAVPVRSQADRPLHARTDLHIARKVWHLAMGVLIVGLYMAGIPAPVGVATLGAILAFTVLLETVRLRSPRVNHVVLKVGAPIMRAHETTRMSTVPQYLLASILAIAIFPKPVAILSILYLACGDPMASLFGIRFGHLGPRFSSGKSFIGTAAGVLVCALVTAIFASVTGLTYDPTVILALSVIGGLAGGTAELLPFEVDDNFTIPTASGFVLWLAFIGLGL
jgi:dolichol kinase